MNHLGYAEPSTQKAALSFVLEKWDGTKNGKKEVGYSTV